MVRFDFPVYIGCECKDSGPIIKCHDTGVTLGLHLKTVTKSRWMQVDEDYRIPDGTTAVIRVKKPDNTVVLTDEGITFEGGSVVVCSKLEQAYTAPGICTAELSLYNPEGKRLTSATFTYEVEKECVCDEDERSEDYMNVLGGMVKEVNAAATSAAESAAEAEEWAKKAAAGGGGSVDSLTADKVTFSDGETFQQKYDSGELRGREGDPGYTPVKGIDYFDGAPGYTPVKGVDYFDGQPGYTPVKNVDYFDGKDGITPHIGDNKNWFIGDTDTGIMAEGKDGQGGSGGSSYVYSIEEIVAGTWIDGKPIYRRVFVGVMDSDEYTRVCRLSEFDGESLVTMSAICNHSSGSSAQMPAGYYGSNGAINIYRDGSGQIILYVSSGNNFKSQPYTAIVEYTKTTDTATIAIPSEEAMMAAYEEGVQNA